MLMKGLETPKFSGQLEEYMDWKVNFKQYVELLSMERGSLPDAVKLEVLSRALDNSNRTILQAHREGGGDFDSFVQILDKRYLSDVQEYHRRRWSNLAFSHPNSICREDVREFRAQFERCRNRVLDATPEEEYGLLMAKLPGSWRERAVAEEEKRNGSSCWVRVGRVGDFTGAEIAEFLETRVGEAPRDMREREGYFLFRFSSEGVQSRVLAFHGKRVNGEPMSVARHRAKMLVGEIFDWMERKLQVVETAAALGGVAVPRVRMVAEGRPPTPPRPEVVPAAPTSPRRSPSPRGRAGDGQGEGGGWGKGRGKGKGKGQGWGGRGDWG
jgi:hypothetical protein